MSLSDILKSINKEFKHELAVKGIGDFVIKKIPFTSPRLNYETYGGIPRGRISMFAGKESSGKSTTALDIVKNAQITFHDEWQSEIDQLNQKINDNIDKKTMKSSIDEWKERIKYLEKRGPLNVVYFDAEGTIDSNWARKIGVDVDNVYLVRLHTQTAEQFLDQVMKVVRDTDDVGLVVIDSIAVLVPQLTHGSSFEQKSMGGNAKVVTDFCNEICPVLGEKDIACIIINQARDDFKNPYAEFHIPCGNGLKLASSLILTFQKGRLLNEKGEEQKQSFETPQGNLVWVRIQKTKVCKPDRRVQYYTLSYDYGIDTIADLIPLAIEYDCIRKAGAWFSILNPYTGEIISDEQGTVLKFQGMLNLSSYLRQNKDLCSEINDYVMNKISGNENTLAISSEQDLAAIKDANDLADDIMLRYSEGEQSELSEPAVEGEQIEQAD